MFARLNTNSETLVKISTWWVPLEHGSVLKEHNKKTFHWRKSEVWFKSCLLHTKFIPAAYSFKYCLYESCLWVRTRCIRRFGNHCPFPQGGGYPLSMQTTIIYETKALQITRTRPYPQNIIYIRSIQLTVNMSWNDESNILWRLFYNLF